MPDSGVDTSIYRNAPNPLSTLSNVYGIMNAAQTNQLLQTANQQRQFDLQKGQNDAINSIIGPLSTIPSVDAKGAQAIILPQLRAMGLDPTTSPIARQHLEPLLSGQLSDPKSFGAWLGGHTAPFLGSTAFSPVTGPATTQGAPTTVLPGERARIAGAPQPTGFGPAATAAAGASGAASGALLGNEATAQTDYRRQVMPLEQAIPALERLGTTGTGPGKDEINQMKSAALSFGFAPKSWTGSIKDFDEAKKYLTDWVRQNGDTSTNDKLAASFSSSASTKISNAAAVDVAKTALAVRRMKYMQLQEFYNKGLPPEEFPKFSSQWNAQHDPRAFGFDHMNVGQRKQIIQSLPPGKRAMFMHDVQAADDAGVLTNQPGQ